MTARDELIARVKARLSRAEHVESISAEISVSDLRTLIALATAPPNVGELVEALDAIRQYGSDTLSGRADGPDNRAWQRESVVEMTRRARAALAKFQGGTK